MWVDGCFEKELDGMEVRYITGCRNDGVRSFSVHSSKTTIAIAFNHTVPFVLHLIAMRDAFLPDQQHHHPTLL